MAADARYRIDGWSGDRRSVIICGEMTVADNHLARIGTVLDEWYAQDGESDSGCEEELPECAREALALAESLQPIIAITIKLGNGKPPGTDVAGDASWAASVALARRDVRSGQALGFDHGLAHDSLRLLDRIDALIGAREDEDWKRATRQRVQALVDAGRRGRERGLRQRDLRERSPEAESHDSDRGAWLLRHPADHWLRQALPSVADPQCQALLEAQIARLQPTYQQLCALDWTAEEAAADLVCEVQVIETSPGGWKQPLPAVVIASIKGNTSFGQQMAVRLVEDFDGPFNGTLLGLLAGERWLLCARELEDGTVLPLDGTRRLAAATR